ARAEPPGGEPGQQMPPSVKSTGWSALGATPSGPPLRTGPQSGGPQYLPPVAPPQTEIATEAVEPARSGARWGWRAFVSFLAGGLIAAAGFGAAQLNAPTETEAVAPTTVSTPATTRPVTTRDSGTVPLAPLDVDEPAAFVAQSLGPAVVQIETSLGLGSGVIYGDGLILTNNHVVNGAQSLRVKLADGRILSAEILGTDENTDVAVVSVGPGLDLPIAQLATGQKARVGQIAIAIGSPFDLQQSVTAGIVSAVDRPIQNNEQSVVAMIQTDAPINPGNSGGALADRQGRVIGINTSIQTDGLTSANVGVGFAIPIDTAIRIADLLVAGEPINPGFLGVRGEEPPGGEAGVRLTEVTAGSAAESAGLLVGDRVLSLDGAPVTEFPELAGLVLANQAGDTVKLEVIREGELVELDVTLGLREEE
ncbi:MAG: S1C family serine protease, partial [Acidimicrobiales bacterium]